MIMAEKPYIDEVLERLEAFKRSYDVVVDGMPDGPAVNAKQQELKDLHGTPKEFAKALLNAVGTISGDEADFHMRAYRSKWEKAAQ